MTGYDQLPIFCEDPYGAEVMRNPYPAYERMRAAGPLVYLEKYGAVASGHYEVVREALRDWRSFTSARGVGLADLNDTERWPGLKRSGLIEQDPPIHTHARSAIAKLFSVKRMRTLTASIRERANEVVARVQTAGSFDAYEELAYPFVLSVVPDIIGVPVSGREFMIPFSSLSIQASTSPHNDVMRKVLADAGPLREWFELASQRENLSPDGMGAEIWAMVDAGEIDAELAQKLIRALMTAGMDTTIYAIVNAIHSFLNFSHQWELLRSRPELSRVVLDETLRYESVTQTITRTVTEDCEFAGARLPGGLKIVLFNAAAGRDPLKWGDRADRFDLEGASTHHLGLGYGIHQCVGQALAKIEVEALFSALAQGDTQLLLGAGEVQILGIPPLRSWKQLPVVLS